MDRDHQLLLHFLAAIAYRAQKALRAAPAGFADFTPGHLVRTPVQVLRHMTSLMGLARTHFVGGSYPVQPDPLPTFDDEIARFHATLEALGEVLRTGTRLRELSTEQLLQGPFADTLTHVGQIAMLRRLAGSPIAPENFLYAEVRTDRLGVEQAPPARPDAHWAERPA